LLSPSNHHPSLWPVPSSPLRATRQNSRPQHQVMTRRILQDTLTTEPVFLRGRFRRFWAGSFPARLNATMPLARVPALPSDGNHRVALPPTGLSGSTAGTVSARRSAPGVSPGCAFPTALTDFRMTTPCPAAHLCTTVYTGGPPRHRSPPQPSGRQSTGRLPPVSRRPTVPRFSSTAPALSRWIGLWYPRAGFPEPVVLLWSLHWPWRLTPPRRLI